MRYSEPTQTTTRRIFGFLVASLIVVITALGYPLLRSSSPAVTPTTSATRSEQPQPPSPQAMRTLEPTTNTARSPTAQPQPVPQQAPDQEAPPPGNIPIFEHHTALGEADGVVDDTTTVFDDNIPALANLDPALLDALHQAATDAADDGIELYVTSGWRSREYQNQLLREAISTYGSEEEAAQWVATPDTSPHVSGAAVDIGHFDAIAWLSEHGAEYGLCQIYSNEPWHYELRPEAIDHGCPTLYADPTHDPRMQK